MIVGGNQCELIIKGSWSSRIIGNFSGDPFEKETLDVFHSSHRVFVTEPSDVPERPTSLRLYRSPTFTDVISQFIDMDGKTRILNYEEVSLIISPIAPLDKPVEGPHLASKDALEQFTGKILYQEIENDRVIGVWVKQGYIPVDDLEPIK